MGCIQSKNNNDNENIEEYALAKSKKNASFFPY